MSFHSFLNFNRHISEIKHKLQVFISLTAEYFTISTICNFAFTFASCEKSVFQVENANFLFLYNTISCFQKCFLTFINFCCCFSNCACLQLIGCAYAGLLQKFTLLCANADAYSVTVKNLTVITNWLFYFVAYNWTS